MFAHGHFFLWVQYLTWHRGSLCRWGQDKSPGLKSRFVTNLLCGHRKSLNFPEPPSKEGSKILLSSPSLVPGKVRREKYRYMLRKWYPMGGIFVNSNNNTKILWTSTPVFLSPFLPSPSFLGVTSGAQAEMEKPQMQRLCYLFLIRQRVGFIVLSRENIM